MPSDKELLQGFVNGRNDTMSFIYREFFPYVEAYVVHNGGTSDQARDIFQDAMIIVHRKISAEQLTLKCKFSTYLYAICKNLWIQDRKKHSLRISKLREMPVVAEPEAPYGNQEDDQAMRLFRKHFDRLGPDCRKILRLFFNGLTLEEIRKEMGFRNVENTSDKKYRCKKKLIQWIQSDPLFKKIKK